MIPLVASVHIQVRRGEQRRLRLWLPVPIVIVWLLLLPIAVVLLPVFVVACLAVRLRPLRTLSVIWGVLSALAGTEFALQHGESAIHVHLT